MAVLLKEAMMQTTALGDDGVQTVRYWLYAPGRGACMWEEFYERGVMGLGWHQLGDLRGYATKEEMRQRLLETRDDNTSQTNSARAVWQFANEMKPGDVIFVKRGLKEIIGRGVVTGDYVYDPDDGEYPHLREVSWNRQGSWRSDQQFAMKTLTEITDYPDLLARIEAYFENDEDSLDSEQIPVPLTEYSAAQFLNEVYMTKERYDAIVGLLRTKKNIIMQGAPGVGKTYAAKRLAYSMMGVKDASRVMRSSFIRATPTRTSSRGTGPLARDLSLSRVPSTPSARRPPMTRRTHISSSSTRSTAATSPRSSASCSCSSRAINGDRRTNFSSSTHASSSTCLATSTLSA